MTKKSCLYIGLIAAIIAFGIAYNLQREYFAKVEEHNALQARQFQINYEQTPPPPGGSVLIKMPDGVADGPTNNTYEPPFAAQIAAYETIAAEMEAEDAQKAAALKARAAGALERYVNNPAILRFNRDMAQAGFENMDITRMNAQDFAALAQKPEVMGVVLKYLQDKEFMAVMKEMSQDADLKAVQSELQAFDNSAK